METYTRVLIERMGMLLILMFIMTRLPLFRMLLDRAITLKTGVLYAVMFGLIGIAGTHAGVLAGPEGMDARFWIRGVDSEQLLAHSALIGVVLAGLFGGAGVGTGAGLIAGAHAASLGGLAAGSYLISTPIIGLLAGLVALFFYEERIIAPIKAFFIGVFAPILQMGIILIYTTSSPESIHLVNEIGVPMVLASSIGIALFVAMIQVALREQERAGAVETQRALAVAGTVLPHLEQKLTEESAAEAARVLSMTLSVDAVAVTDMTSVLAYTGPGMERSRPEHPAVSSLCQKAVRTGEVVVAELAAYADSSSSQAEGGQLKQKLTALARRGTLEAKQGPGAVVLIPFQQAGQPVGVLQLFYRSRKHVRKVEEEFASGLSKLISTHLTLARATELEVLTKDAELRALQAQIHPHFLFNTLNSIVTLIRTNPGDARHLTRQLAQFMRASLRTAQSPLIPLQQELEHLRAYLDILHIRFGDQMRLECDAAGGLQDVLIPPSTLQPLVENSIQHGLASRLIGGVVQVSVRREGGAIRIGVQDNGIGIRPELLSILGVMPLQSGEESSGMPSTADNGLGVYNVNERLIRLVGAEAALHYSNLPEGGSRVEFRLPGERREYYEGEAYRADRRR
ncbi:two-component system, LytT family, sensor histidine kinase LytS [Paenibacillaceae bacterium GAS479]|nr:two-component system, LytT family, sensor histidine kinase LytS [Paenibacillaceae bacterium GAS479]